jgi:hypothetical protein
MKIKRERMKYYLDSVGRHVKVVSESILMGCSFRNACETSGQVSLY